MLVDQKRRCPECARSVSRLASMIAVIVLKSTKNHTGIVAYTCRKKIICSEYLLYMSFDASIQSVGLLKPKTETPMLILVQYKRFMGCVLEAEY